MADASEISAPTLPIPIFQLGSRSERFMLYDADTVAWLRREHRILGVMTGTLPQIPQQNVFLGLPLELMSEEARLLVEAGVAYIVHDAERHRALFHIATVADREAYRALVRAQASQASQAAAVRRDASKASALQRASAKQEERVHNDSKVPGNPVTTRAPLDSLFEADDGQQSQSNKSNPSAEQWGCTPSTSFPLIPRADPGGHNGLPVVDESSFALFKHLHESGYFLSPGLRFGCQFMAYPGDPLRYHSHFLAVGADWEEELDLLDLIGRGRLGTGVKKGFLLGGPTKQADGSTQTRTFCLEWSGM